MPRAAWLLRVSLLAAAVAAACGTDTINLLPLAAGGSASSSSGSAGFAGTDPSSGGRPDAAGASAMSGTATVGGALSSGGGGGSENGGGDGATSGSGGDCNGSACAGGGGDNGAGGDAGICNDYEFFCPCDPPARRCGAGTVCNLRMRACTSPCDSPYECPEGFLCEEHTCGICTENSQCALNGPFGRRVCVDGFCEECEGPSDCLDDEPRCIGQRCMCVNDDDCPSHVCNKQRGRCEK